MFWLYFQFKNSTGTFSHNFDNFCCMKKKSKYTRAFEVTNFGLFFLNIILIESHLQIWLSTSASQKHANVFKYSLKFCTEETNVKLYHLNHVSKMPGKYRSRTDFLGDVTGANSMHLCHSTLVAGLLPGHSVSSKEHLE